MLTGIHWAWSDVVDANTAGLEFFADSAVGVVSVLLSVEWYGEGMYRVKCSTGALLPA